MGAGGRVTIRDVAAECGLAVSTISNALADKPCVRLETRERVRMVAEKLGYRASILARGLRLKKASAIGVLVADVANPSVVDHLRGIDDIAMRENYSVVLGNTDDSEANQIRLMHALRDRQVDGMILISQKSNSDAVRRLLSHIPFVLMHRRCARFNDPYVAADLRQATEATVRHLAELGHRRVAFVRGPADSSAAQERLAAFRKCIRTYGLEDSPELIHPGDYSTEAGHAAAESFLGLSVPPTAIIASNDVNALAIIESCYQRGLSVPEAVSVVGYDNIALANFSRINLTTVQSPRREMGRCAAEMLIKLIQGDETAARERIFPTTLIVRGSTAAPRSQKTSRIAAARRRVAVEQPS